MESETSMKKIKWGISVLLLLCLVLGGSVTVCAKPVTVNIPYGQGDEKSDGYLAVPRIITDTESAINPSEVEEKYESGKKNTLLNTDGERTNVLPSSYDSRRYVNEAGIPYIQPVRNQGADGTCWAFSVCSAAETSMIKQNLFLKNGYLSPLQFAWFHYNRIENPLKLSGIDRVLTDKNILEAGGNEYLSVFALANWIGLVDEGLAPYETAPSVALEGLKNSLCYSKNKACLENAVWTSADRPDTIKELIMENGSAMLPFYMSDLYYNSATGGYYCSDAKYNGTDDSFSSNHIVTIVGWDDTYSRNNFKTAPEKDGAWLIKNSWGTHWGTEGYFWLSYYDKSIYEEVNGTPVGATVTAFQMTKPDAWDNNYGYDGGGGISWYYFIDDITGEPISSAMMANVYTAQYEELLSAVSFYTIQEDVSYTIYVFCGVDPSVSPTGGLFPAATVSGAFKNAGYHTVSLPEELSLSPGMKYTIAIELTSQREGEAVKLMADGSDVWEWVRFSSVVGKGESYYREPGKQWIDVAEDMQTSWYGNFRIRALTRLAHKDTGDINASGSLTAEDALELLKITVGINSTSYWREQVGDLDADNQLTATDALIILKTIVGIQY